MINKKIDIDGINISYGDNENYEKPILVFLHGNSSSRTVLSGLIDLIVSDYHIVSIDLPGHGQSDKSNNPSIDYTIKGYSKLVISVIEGLNLAGCILIGHSLGGHVAIESLPYIHDLAGLVLISAPPISESNLSELFFDDPTDGAIFTSSINEHQITKITSCFANAHNIHPNLFKSIYQSIENTDPNVRQYIGHSLLSGDFSNEVVILRAYKKPFISFFGKEDPFIKLDAAYDALKDSSVHSQSYIVLGASHSPHIENAESFVIALKKYITSLKLETTSCV